MFKQIVLFPVVALILLTSLSAAIAGPLEDAKAAIRKHDFAAAIQILQPLVDLGDAEAQLTLGNMNLTSIEDYTEAAKWYRMAAEQGYAEAQYMIAFMYTLGYNPTPKNYTEAAKWYRLAAEQGHYKAQHYLGMLYSFGEGVPQDYILAHMWLNLAAAQSKGPPWAPDEAKKARDEVASQMTPDQVAEAQRLAQEWKPK